MDTSDESDLPAYFTPLYWAVTGRNFTQARALIDSGHPIDDEPSNDGYTMLHGASQRGETETVRFLLSAGCRLALNTFDYVSKTPLIWAAEKGHLEVAELLLSAGAEVNANEAFTRAPKAGALRRPGCHGRDESNVSGISTDRIK